MSTTSAALPAVILGIAREEDFSWSLDYHSAYRL